MCKILTNKEEFVYDHCIELRRQVQLCHEESIMSLKTTLGIPIDTEFESEEKTAILDSMISKIDAFEATCLSSPFFINFDIFGEIKFNEIDSFYQLAIFNLSVLTYWNAGQRLYFKDTIFQSKNDLSRFDSFKESVHCAISQSKLIQKDTMMTDMCVSAVPLQFIRNPTPEMCMAYIRNPTQPGIPYIRNPTMPEIPYTRNQAPANNTDDDNHSFKILQLRFDRLLVWFNKQKLLIVYDLKLNSVVATKYINVDSVRLYNDAILVTEHYGSITVKETFFDDNLDILPSPPNLKNTREQIGFLIRKNVCYGFVIYPQLTNEKYLLSNSVRSVDIFGNKLEIKKSHFTKDNTIVVKTATSYLLLRQQINTDSYDLVFLDDMMKIDRDGIANLCVTQDFFLLLKENIIHVFENDKGHYVKEIHFRQLNGFKISSTNSNNRILIYNNLGWLFIDIK